MDLMRLLALALTVASHWIPEALRTLSLSNKLSTIMWLIKYLGEEQGPTFFTIWMELSLNKDPSIL